MYPTIHNFDASSGAVNPLLGGAGYPSTSGSGPAAIAQPPRAANGPPPPPAPAFPTLQVAIDPRFQVAPPVRAPPQPPGEGGPAAGSHSAVAPPPPPGHPAPGSRQPLDLDLERKLLEELGSSGRGGNGGAAAAPSSSLQQREDPYNVLLGRYTEMGYGRDEVAMALAIVGPNDADKPDLVVDACRKYKKLNSMGFRADHVVGALIVHKGDVEQSANACSDALG